MTPQLYINYKLQSVEHMPQRTMIYRFLNTIIDDLFSFIITMPTMHRLSCFRDDIIFVIYLYQRWYYRIDKTRGIYATEKKPSAVTEGDAGLEEKATTAIEGATSENTAVETGETTATTEPVTAEDKSDETKKDK